MEFANPSDRVLPAHNINKAAQRPRVKGCIARHHRTASARLMTLDLRAAWLVAGDAVDGAAAAMDPPFFASPAAA